ncbi:hypothetical protein BU14_0273s0003 [Porphyra umbilicalis]|uniref:Uncharacterized protein n=1 Tax=Porphyra umbilicalis TaxID=2786 RepID=A0A1X6P1D4_PORUM|nr:hypothetical protein BU14_0273s0003 [Porphyra umbilicalis]|eukprot:OSX74678.1 hypothetical protein BU14_0273s0003 [Porphyra umbilicalis]
MSPPRCNAPACPSLVLPPPWPPPLSSHHRTVYPVPHHSYCCKWFSPHCLPHL